MKRKACASTPTYPSVTTTTVRDTPLPAAGISYAAFKPPMSSVPPPPCIFRISSMPSRRLAWVAGRERLGLHTQLAPEKVTMLK